MLLPLSHMSYSNFTLKMPLPSGIRLRESCEHCTNGKVRCSKDKPTCKRCNDRGLECEYAVTLKTGRRRIRRHDASRFERMMDQLEPRPQRIAEPIPSGPGAIRTYESLPYTFGDIFRPESNAFTRVDEVPSSLPGAVDLSILDLPVLPDVWDPSIFTESGNGPWFADTTFFDTGLVPPTDTDIPLFQSQESSSHEPTTSIMGTSDPVTSTRSAIQLLDKLSTSEPDSPPRSTVNTPPAKETAVSQYLSQIVARNTPTIQTITNILQPLRTQDSYMLVLACLILHKIVSAYVSVFQFGEELCLKGDLEYEESPAALRTLVDELFHVRKLVGMVRETIRLTSLAEDDTELSGNALRGTGESDTSPITRATLLGMHEDLSKRLNVLSLKSIEELKRFWN